MRKCVSGLVALLCGAGVALAQSGNASTDDYNKYKKAETERNTTYHNNADNYSKPSVPPPASTSGYHAPPKAPPPEPSHREPSYAETTDVGYGPILVPSDEYTPAQKFTLHKNRADFGVASEMVWVAQITLEGVSYRDSAGQLQWLYPKNPEMAFSYYSKAAPTIPYAEYKSGKMLYLGKGTPEDRVEGLKRMQSAAARGEAIAVAGLKELHLPITGSGSVAPVSGAAGETGATGETAAPGSPLRTSPR